MRESAARACWQRRLNYQNCVVWNFAPSAFSGGTVLLNRGSALR
ncbi:hypothetical protein ECSTECC16502_2581 [Escherichia coli STEC_C165-02]|nr:hypothetical protein ECSTECC16502_2581 [Escherichia coli STEC_C165-02]